MSHTQAAYSDHSELKFLADRAYDKENQALASSVAASQKQALNSCPTRVDSLNQAPGALNALNDPANDNYNIFSLTVPSTGLVNNFGDSDTKSLIAIIGKVLALQAKSSSEYWSSLWQQATTSMSQSVALAPMIYDQVTQSYANQSQQTQDESDSAFAQGMTQSVTAGLSIVVGVMSGVNLASEEAKNPTSQFKNQLEDDAEDVSASSKKGVGQDDEAALSKLEKNSKTDADEKVTDKMSRSLNQGRFMKGLGKLFKALTEAQPGIQIINSAGQAATSFIDSHYKSDIAAVQLLIGKYEATSKELEQFAQYYNQSFQRSEDLRGGSQNNIDTAMQILKSIADTLTQTTQSMFRG